jgi:adenylate cyclase
MTQIYYHPDEKQVTVEETETILRASLRSGIPHTHVCGGKARCSTCRVMIVEGLENLNPRNEREQTMAERLKFGPNIRLACQTTFQGEIRLRRLVIDDEDIKLDDQTAPGREEGEAVGSEKRIAILFSDVRGFTTFSEALPAYDVIHALNRYFHQIGQVISNHGGYIDNYMGDGIMALFGVNDPTDAPLRAVRAGLDMLRVVDESIRPYFEAIYAKVFDIGIGIHFGEAVVGTIGARNRKTQTAIGDSVNFASRIESANKEAGTRLLISDDTYAAVRDDVRVGKTTRMMVKGKSGEYMLYEVTELRN